MAGPFGLSWGVAGRSCATVAEVRRPSGRTRPRGVPGCQNGSGPLWIGGMAAPGSIGDAMAGTRPPVLPASGPALEGDRGGSAGARQTRAGGAERGARGAQGHGSGPRAVAVRSLPGPARRSSPARAAVPGCRGAVAPHRRGARRRGPGLPGAPGPRGDRDRHWQIAHDGCMPRPRRAAWIGSETLSELRLPPGAAGSPRPARPRRVMRPCPRVRRGPWRGPPVLRPARAEGGL